MTMSWCLLMLAKHPDIQQKARNEVMSVVSDFPLLNNECLEKLQYCTCVIKEILRYSTCQSLLNNNNKNNHSNNKNIWTDAADKQCIQTAV